MKVTVQGLGATPTNNVEIVLTPSGQDNVALGLVDLDGDETARKFPLTLRGSQEKTKKGVRRIMLAASVKLPTSDSSFIDLATAAPSYTGAGDVQKDIGAHLVLTLPKGVGLPLEGGAPQTAIVERGIQLVLTALVSLITGDKSIASYGSGTGTLIAADGNAPLVRGLLGAWPMDTFTGDYGAAT